MPSDRREEIVLPWWLPVAVAGLLLAIYWPALHGARVWDDQAHITKPALQSGHGLVAIWTDLRATQQYYPVLHTAFWVEHRLWGEATVGYHLINLLWHGTACCLFALVLLRLGFARIAACAAALLFAVHPATVESVAWISEQKNTLSLVFALLAALAYLRFDASRNPRTYALGSLWFLLALATKSVTATLPGALLVALWWRDGVPGLRRAAATLGAWLVLGLASGLVTAHLERTMIGAEGAEFSLSFLQRLCLAGRVVWFYLGKLLVPHPLLFVYPHWSSFPAYGLLAALAVTGALWFVPRRGPLATWLCFGGLLFPVLGFVNVYPFRFSYVADHFQYLAMLPIFAAAGAVLVGHRDARLTGVTFAVLFAFLAHFQAATFRSDLALYEHTLAYNPAAWMPAHNLGTELAAQGRQAEAIPYFAQAVAAKPDYSEALINWGSALLATGHPADAVDKFQRALAITPHDPDAHNDLGIALARLGRRQEAAAAYLAASRDNPNYAPAYFNMGNLLRQTGDLDGAVNDYSVAIRLNPHYSEALMNRALIALQRGDLPAAVTNLQAAIAAKPDFAEAHNNLASAYQREQRFNAAIAEYREAIRLAPGYRTARFNLANALHQAGGHEEEALAELHAARALPAQ